MLLATHQLHPRIGCHANPLQPSVRLSQLLDVLQGFTLWPEYWYIVYHLLVHPISRILRRYDPLDASLGRSLYQCLLHIHGAEVESEDCSILVLKSALEEGLVVERTLLDTKRGVGGEGRCGLGSLDDSDAELIRVEEVGEDR